jgi:hypothetical protein
MTEPLKTITVIVDRRVLAKLLQGKANQLLLWGGLENLEPAEQLFVLADEVESGQRCELYARDWPLE